MKQIFTICFEVCCLYFHTTSNVKKIFICYLFIIFISYQNSRIVSHSHVLWQKCVDTNFIVILQQFLINENDSFLYYSFDSIFSKDHKCIQNCLQHEICFSCKKGPIKISDKSLESKISWWANWRLSWHINCQKEIKYVED